jgi:chromosome segregation protein
MKKYLESLHVVQFSFWDKQTFKFSRKSTGIFGANGAGKTSLLDAIQIAMLGAHGSHINFNAQSSQKDSRLLRDYALGTMRSDDGQSDDQNYIKRKRDEAISYITMVFRGAKESDTVSAGICIASSVKESAHKVLGRYVIPGIAINLDEHIETSEDGSLSPEKWGYFEQKIRAKKSITGRTTVICETAEEYIRELFHNVQDSSKSRDVDVNQFIRAFKQSINLKSVDSIDAFLRKYLVQPEKEKKSALSQINFMRDLNNKVKDTEDEISVLENLESEYNRLKLIDKDIFSLRYARERIEIEKSEQDLNDKKGEIGRLKDGLEAINKKKNACRSEEARFAAEALSLERSKQNDPEIIKRKTAEIDLMNAKKELDREMFFVCGRRAAISRLIEELLNTDTPKEIQIKLEEARKSVLIDECVPVNVMQNALSLIEEIKLILEKKNDEMSVKVDGYKRECVDAKNRLSAAVSGMVLGSGSGAVEKAIAELAKIGIKAKTVASVSSVSDSSWQSAIESFLGDNRFSLIIDKSEASLGGVLGGDVFSGVKIIFGDKLEKCLTDNVGAASNLIQSENSIAKDYLRGLLCGLELKEKATSLNENCLLKNGISVCRGVLDIPVVVSKNYFAIGIKPDKDGLLYLEQGVGDANKKIDTAMQRQKDIKTLKESCASFLSNSNILEYEQKIINMDSLEEKINSLRNIGSSIVLLEEIDKKIIKIKESAAKCSIEWERLTQSSANCIAEIGVHSNEVESLQKKINGAEFRIDEMRAEDNAEGFDFSIEGHILMGNISSTSDRQSTYSGDKIEEKIKAQKKIFEKRERDTAKLFDEYTRVYSKFNGLSSGGWTGDAKFVVAQKQILLKTELPKHKDKAKEAYITAVETFNSDIKNKMKDASLNVRAAIKELNEVLKKCPEFSGGERYVFTCTENPFYKDLWSLLKKDGGEDQRSFFDEENPSAQDALLIQYERMQSGTKNSDNPFEDVRVLFNFDMDIRVDDVVVEKLSKRMGKGSNGEHRVPFYVIAGAALAAAYRIENPLSHQGIGMMLLDEAFYGMDSNNMEASAAFLNALGLQLIMAGPDKDIPQFIPILESYYEIQRNVENAYAYWAGVTDELQELFVSDRPDKNPELLKKRAALIRAEKLMEGGAVI